MEAQGQLNCNCNFFSFRSSKPLIRIGIQPKMLDLDPYQNNTVQIRNTGSFKGTAILPFIKKIHFQSRKDGNKYYYFNTVRYLDTVASAAVIEHPLQMEDQNRWQLLQAEGEDGAAQLLLVGTTALLHLAAADDAAALQLL